MSTKQEFLEQFPDTFFACKDSPSALTEYLKQISLLQKDDAITNLSVPGAGNMNVVIRIQTNQRSFILKQSRPWVEKYPSIEAPIERIHIEADYYESIQSSSFLKDHSPKILYHDPVQYLLIMEDLGGVEDYTKIYTDQYSLSSTEIDNLSNYLIELHRFKPESFPSNKDMRLLNHAHIFNIPFQSDNGLDLDGIQPGLADLARSLSEDSVFKSVVANYGKLYLSQGSALLHGDFYPGSWMQSDQFYVLDPEFSFLGPPEFDLGVCLAHLKMSHQEDELIQLFLKKYKEALAFNENHVKSFAGIEILRRLLGVAQLPLAYSLEQKKELIELSRSWIINR